MNLFRLFFVCLSFFSPPCLFAYFAGNEAASVFVLSKKEVGQGLGLAE